MYEYHAHVRSVYDADTLRLTVDLGMDTYVRHSVRLIGIDTPEISGEQRPQGLVAKDYVSTWLATHCAVDEGMPLVVINTIKDRREKYGRYLVIVYNTDKTRCLNDDLIDSGNAVAYDGGAR